jgi:hypothetical protein
MTVVHLDSRAHCAQGSGQAASCTPRQAGDRVLLKGHDDNGVNTGEFGLLAAKTGKSLLFV